MKRYLIPFLLLVSLSFGVSQTFVLPTVNIPADFFMGKWGGTISGEIVEPPPKYARYPFNLELVGYTGKGGIGPFGGVAEAWMKMSASWPGNFTVVFDTVMCGVYPQFVNILYPVNNPATITDLGYNTIFTLAGFGVQVENKNLIRLTSGGADEQLWTDSWAKGELYRIYMRKDTLEATDINEAIKTDKFTRREIVVPDIGEIIVNTNSEAKFSENKFLEQTMGEIYSKIKPGVNYKVRIRNSGACAVRGTQLITRVEKDGTITLKVLDGEVEFSDVQNRKTVVVKKCQISVINPGGLPSEPVTIDPKQIPRWWE